MADIECGSSGGSEAATARRDLIRERVAAAGRAESHERALRLALRETGMEIAVLMHRWNVARVHLIPIRPGTPMRSLDGVVASARDGGGSLLDERRGFDPHIAPEESESAGAAVWGELGRGLRERLMPDRRVLAHRVKVGASAVLMNKACNRKLGPIAMRLGPTGKATHLRARPPYVAATYASIQTTCPSSCPYKRTAAGVARGCFVDSGFTRALSQRLDVAAGDLSPEQVMAEEARELDLAFRGGRIPQDGARGGRDLRLHVGGDVGSAAGARLLGHAALRWRERGGGAVWTYTHAWRHIPRAAFGPISVFASCETAADAQAASDAGYAVAVTVDAFSSHRAVDALEVLGGDVVVSGKRLKVVPCPAESGEGVTCASCRLCLDRDVRRLGIAIGFALHGKHVEQARQQLVQLRTPGAPAPKARPVAPRGCRICRGLDHNAGNERYHPKAARPARVAERKPRTGLKQCSRCLRWGHNARNRECAAAAASFTAALKVAAR